MHIKLSFKIIALQSGSEFPLLLSEKLSYLMYNNPEEYRRLTTLMISNSSEEKRGDSFLNLAYLSQYSREHLFIPPTRNPRSRSFGTFIQHYLEWREAGHKLSERVGVRQISPTIGKGLFAKTDLKPGDIAGVFQGIYKNKAFTEREKIYRLQAWPTQDATFYLVPWDTEKAMPGGAFRANCGIPNCCSVSIGGFQGLMAITDIKKGEEILWDYAMSAEFLIYNAQKTSEKLTSFFASIHDANSLPTLFQKISDQDFTPAEFLQSCYYLETISFIYKNVLPLLPYMSRENITDFLNLTQLLLEFSFLPENTQRLIRTFRNMYLSALANS
jgi:hypothetical protein